MTTKGARPPSDWKLLTSCELVLGPQSSSNSKSTVWLLVMAGLEQRERNWKIAEGRYVGYDAWLGVFGLWLQRWKGGNPGRCDISPERCHTVEESLGIYISPGCLETPFL